MTDILVLNRPPLVYMPYSDWLGEGADIRMITHPGALGGAPAPEGTVVLDDYDVSGLIEHTAWSLYQERPFSRIVALSDHDMVRAARLREVLGLPGQDVASAVAFRDKSVMKRLLQAAGVPVADYAELHTATDLLEFAQRHAYPLVVKPRLSTGSRGVNVLEGPEQLRDWLEFGWSLPLDVLSTWMVETFVEGEMLHIDGLWNHGALEVAWPSSTTSLLGFPERRPLMSAMLDTGDPLVAEARKLLAASIEALPHPDVMIFHAEFWRTPDGTLVLNEIASRQGGAKVGPAVRAAFGVHLMRRCVRAQVRPELLTAEVVPDGPLRNAGWALVPKGRGTLLEAADPAGAFPDGWFTEATVSAKIGDKAEGAMSSVDSVASCLAVGRDHGEVLDRLQHFATWAGQTLRWSEG